MVTFSYDVDTDVPSFKIESDLGIMEFVIVGECECKLEVCNGLYSKHSTTVREPHVGLCNSINSHFDGDLYWVRGEVMKHCPWCFVVDLKSGNVFGVDVEIRRSSLEDKPNIHVPCERVSPSAMTYPKHYYVSYSKSDNVAYITSFNNVLECYKNRKLVDIKGRLYIEVDKELWVKVRVR